MLESPIPLVGLIAYSGTGKTTLLVKLLPLLKAQGLRIGVIKHAHHQFEIDKPGKDSYRFRYEGGADQVMIASRQRWALMQEIPNPQDEPRLVDVLPCFNPEQLDLLMVEGFKHEAFPKIEVYRASLGRPLLSTDDPNVVAIASDEPLQSTLPVFDMNQPENLAGFIYKKLLGGLEKQ